MQAQDRNGGPRRGMPQGAPHLPHTLNPAMTAAKEKSAVANLNEATAIKPATNEDPVAKGPTDEKKTADGRNDAAIIDALMRRQWDRIIPYLPDGDDPVSIKLDMLYEKYGIHHPLIEEESDESEETDSKELEATERDQHN